MGVIILCFSVFSCYGGVICQVQLEVCCKYITLLNLPNKQHTSQQCLSDTVTFCLREAHGPVMSPLHTSGNRNIELA